MNKKFNDSSYSKLIEARKKYLKKITIIIIFIITLNIITIISISLDSSHLLSFLLIIFDLLITIFFIIFAGFNIGFKSRIKVYDKVTSFLPKCEIVKVHKSIANDYVIYRFKFNNSMKRMKISIDSGGKNEGAYCTISLKNKAVFDLFIWKIENEIFETDNKNLLKSKPIMNKLNMGDEIHLNNGDLLIKGRTCNQKNIINLIQIMIEILKESEKRGEPLPRNKMPENFSFWFGPRKYTVCLNCEEIIGKWTKKNHIEVYKCPKCYNDSYGIIAIVGKDIQPKIKEIKNLENK